MLVVALQWSLKSNTLKLSTRQDHSILLSDVATAQAFCKDIVDNFKWVEREGSNNYSRIVDLIRQSLNNNVPKVVHRKKYLPWIDPDICSLRTHYRASRLKAQIYPSLENKAAASNFALQLSELYCTKQKDYLNGICVDIMKLTGENQVKKAWDIINLITNRKARSTGLIPALDDHDRLSKWYNHFSKLLSPQTPPVRIDLRLTKVFNDLKFQCGAITIKEVEDAIKVLQNGKATGVDDISAEILKCPGLLDMAWRFLHYCYETKTVPKEWHTSLIVPVFKKGDSSICSNYRGIALMSVYAKLYNRILFARLRDTLDMHLRPNQNGFRPLRSTAQQVLALRRLIEEISSTRTGKLIAVFIDFSKAFDSVDWNYIENILLAYDVPKSLVDAIMSLYYNAQASVKVGSNISESFDLGVGVLQGDTLAPYLFVIVLDWVLRHALSDDSLGVELSPPKRTRSRIITPGKYLTDLDFADDIALLSGSLLYAQRMLLDVEVWAAKVGLKINHGKTEYLLVGNWEAERLSPVGIRLSLSTGAELKEVSDFKYLGSWLLNSKKDFSVRKALAWSAITRLNRIWKSTVLQRKIKFTLFTALIESILLYNAVTWTMNKTLTRLLDGAYNRLLRYALNINWKDRVTNISIFGDDIIPVSQRLRQRRLTFIGHCLRSPQSAPQPIADLLLWQPHPSLTRKPGRRSNYRKILCDETGRDVQQLQDDVYDRIYWRGIVRSICHI